MDTRCKKKVLVISYLPWSNEISVGNTLSNLFSGLEEFEFASLYFKGGIVNNGIAKRYFYISEKELAKSIIKRHSVGKEIKNPEKKKIAASTNSRLYDKARMVRWESLLLCQDCVGLLGKWKTKALDDFIEDFKPDIIFGPLGRVPVANLVIEYIYKKYNVPVITYAWDDHYSLHKKSASPFFWIKTMLERKFIKRSANVSSFLYTITEPMKEEYNAYFQKNCKVLYKAYDFIGEAPIKKKIQLPIKMIYMGNLGSGRWQELAKLINAVSRINKNEKRVEIFIYSLSPKNKEMLDALCIEGTSSIMNPVANEDVIPKMKSADILLHVEPTNKKDLQFFRLSFSTKIVDYLYNARCILAFGGSTAAMSYLKQNEAAIVVEDATQLEKQIRCLLDNPDEIIQRGRKAWECGVRNHQRQTIQTRLSSDLNEVIFEGKAKFGEKK